MPKKPAPRRKPVRRRPQSPVERPAAAAEAVEQPASLRGALAQNLADNARLMRELESQRAQTESLAKELNRLDMDLSRSARGVLEAADALERLHGAETDDVEAYRASVRRTADELSKALGRHSGIELIGRPGELFDPSVHRAIEAREDAEAPADTVLAVVGRGLKYRGELVQTASVIVSTGQKTPSEEGATE
ncbi:nucleotide exchange factor GrpE [Glycomyces buryatensis]|nr:nucleotide exchange factor GrpE [Glycomyces buryatensis]